MPHPTSAKIRRDFLEFFAARGHRIVPSSPVFPQDDPTLLFTNAGMNQFKDVFLGTGRRDYKRAVDTQKCIRVSGKHNDLEEVGYDTYHHTFFEMLGNWSFGDYFKAEAIPWAWELLTRTWKLDKARLWVTVFGGDEKDGLPRDEASACVWKESTDVDPSHVLFFGRKANFWEMGDTGPCGPCTEIHIDRGGPDMNPLDGADPRLGVNAGNERFIELWNNVFMEFNRQDDGKLVKLPAQHVDTGMGFERIVSVLQGKDSNYDTDIFAPIFARIGELSGKRYGSGDARADVAFRVVADHVRAVTSAFADGALPSNVGRGYVLRRLIRRASRYGRQALGLEDPFLGAVAPAVADTLGEVFPEIPRRMEHVQLLLRTEEEAFGKTLGRGLVRFGELAGRVEKSGQKALDGAQAFELYATYGFPQDLVELMARERGLSVDLRAWETAREAHQAASRSEDYFKHSVSSNEVAGIPPTRRTYFEPDDNAYELVTSVAGIVWSEGAPGRATVNLILEASPFYPEGGGQVGDTGRITSLDGQFELEVQATAKRGDIVLHEGRVLKGGPDNIRDGTPVLARVDRERRDRTSKNHTATHLLHKALKEVLGEHVGQQGSYVGPDRLRFDFSHPRAVTPAELEEIERRVNAQVYGNAAVKTTIEPLEAAKARGVVAMFGEKYGEMVRVLDVGGWSLELCGGTHVRAAGDIGPFVISAESAIQAGVRRIEALTGPEAVAQLQRQRRELLEASRALKTTPEELAVRIDDLQKKLKEARKDAAKHSKADLDQVLSRARAALRVEAGLALGVVETELDLEGLRELGARLRGGAPDLGAVLVGREEGKVPWIVCAQGKALAHGYDSRRVVAFLRARLGGGGGGKNELCQGQGQDAAALPAALRDLAPKLADVFLGRMT